MKQRLVLGWIGSVLIVLVRAMAGSPSASRAQTDDAEATIAVLQTTVARQAEVVQDLRALLSEAERANDELRTQVASAGTDGAPRPTRSNPRPTRPAAEAPLEILDVTTEPTGLGDGSLYTYFDIVNRSDRLYEYVGVDATCRDADGRVVATAIGNTLNLAPGESTVITVIFLGAEGCEDVDIEIDDLTDLIN